MPRKRRETRSHDFDQEVVKEINRQKGTQYVPQEFYNKSDLLALKFKWMNARLGKNLNEIEDELGVPLDIRSEWLDTDLDLSDELRKSQEAEDDARIEEEQKKRDERYEKIEGESKAPIPIGTPSVDNEIFTASRVSPTISGTVDQTTGLTGTQSALLSPLEQEIAKKKNQGIGSLA